VRKRRISELLQVDGVDPLTVAAQTGTSLAMIEKAYLRFIPSAMRETMAHINETPSAVFPEAGMKNTGNTVGLADV
jgi:hypothetical protein